MLYCICENHRIESRCLGRANHDIRRAILCTWLDLCTNYDKLRFSNPTLIRFSKLSKHYHKFPHPSLTSPTAYLIRLHKIKLADVDDWIDLRLNKGMAWNSFGANWNRKWSQRELNWLWRKVCWPDTHSPVCAWKPLCVLSARKMPTFDIQMLRGWVFNKFAINHQEINRARSVHAQIESKARKSDWQCT